MLPVFTSDIVNLNVGGQKFSTSRQTLCSVADSFFSSLLSGRIASCRDEQGYIFIDRDPKYFSIILNFLRTRELNLNGIENLSSLRNEAEFYGIAPLIKRLILCEDLDRSQCGDILFTGFIPTPLIISKKLNSINVNASLKTNGCAEQSNTTNCSNKPGNVLRICNSKPPMDSSKTTQTNDFTRFISHSRKSSNEVNCFTNYSAQCSSSTCSTGTSVNSIAGHQNWIAVAYSHYVSCYKLKDGMGWQLMFLSEYQDEEIERLAINSKNQFVNFSSLNSSTPTSSNNSNQNSNNNSSSNLRQTTNPSDSNLNQAVNSSPNKSILTNTNQNNQIYENSKYCTLVALSSKHVIKLWAITDEPNEQLIGNFNLGSLVENLFFIGSQLVATSSIGKIGVWNSLSQQWQTQDLTPITSYDTAGSVLLLGSQNGLLYYIDMQKFPLRMKDNDLLVTQLYKDPLGEPITALSVYLTPKTTNTGNWIEIAYGTSTGNVRVIVQHPETVGHSPQLFQSFSVHRGSVFKVMLTEKHLISVCSEFNHVRTWNVTRFRGMISTQPGSTPLASFKIMTIEAADAPPSYASGNDIGPYGERDSSQLFVQKVVPYTEELLVRLSSTGKRICTIKSVDHSMITSFCVHECEEPSKINSRPRRYLFTGHSNGTLQLWDLTTALEMKQNDQTHQAGPTVEEFTKFLDKIELSSSTTSGYSTPNLNCLSPPISNLHLKHHRNQSTASGHFIPNSNLNNQSNDSSDKN
ncbi:unnamed protein product [Brachionus calyciflorus]|uniref:BTB domain-containing protein n=1 Tax=Brachionus calyciflorus TaxID=104777 RepID=A0A813QRN7_9BILA|nr:unnamed protein product [Brachionus calyciflorus]